MPYVRSTLAVSRSIPAWLAGTGCISLGYRARMERTRCSGGPRRSVALEGLPDVLQGLGERSWGAGSETAWPPKLSSI